MLWDNLLQRLYRGLFENSKDAIFITTREGMILDANQSFLELFGYLEEELLTMNDMELYVNDSVREVFIAEIEKSGAVKDFELKMRTKDDQALDCIISSSVHYASDGTVLGYQGIVRDITKRKKLEKLQAVSYKIAAAAYKAMDLQKLFKYIHLELSSIIDTKNFYIALYDEATEELSFPYYQDENYTESGYVPTTRKLGKGLTDYVVRTGKPLYANGDNKLQELTESGEVEINGPTPLNWIGVPLISSENIIGVIAVQSYSSHKLYSKADMELLEFVSGQIAVTIARQQSEELLKNSRANLNALIENTSSGIFSVDRHMKFITFNSSFEKQFKIAYGTYPMVQADMDEVLKKKEIVYWQGLLKKALKGKRFSVERKFDINGHQVQIEASFNPIEADTEITGVSVFIENVTKKKKTQETLLQMTRQKLKQEIKEQRIRAEAVIEGQDEERQRIALELHDGLGQMLTAIKLNLASITKGDLTNGQRKIKEIKKLLNETMAETKRVSHNLMPSVLKDFGLVPTVELLCEQNTNNSETQIIFQSFGVSGRLDTKIERGLYRIVQEAINNSLKYANASEINVQLLQKKRFIRLMVEDDGVGFDVEKIHTSKNLKDYRQGLYNMRERANLLNGKINIDSSPNSGVTIAVEVPLKMAKNVKS